MTRRRALGANGGSSRLEWRIGFELFEDGTIDGTISAGVTYDMTEVFRTTFLPGTFASWRVNSGLNGPIYQATLDAWRESQS